MNTFFYNDNEFLVENSAGRWNISRILPDGSFAAVGSGLYEGSTSEQALQKSRSLVREIYPAGVRIVGPDVAHPNTVGDLRIIGPNVNHPNFIYWNQDSSSLLK